MSGTHPDRNHLYHSKVTQKVLLALYTFYYQEYTGQVICGPSINDVVIFFCISFYVICIIIKLNGKMALIDVNHVCQRQKTAC